MDSGQEVLISGKTSFKIEVPYKLIESGKKGAKPLIVYLHGFGHNLKTFHKEMSGLLNFNAYHLFIQGPYPIYDTSRKSKVEDWGRAWYLYDGHQTQFLRSLELSSEFVQDVIDALLDHIDVTRLCLIGYSMGAYLAGYFTLSRWKHVTDLVMIGGRLKTEVFEDRKHNYDHVNVLALHGKNDRSVEAAPQEECVKQMQEWGAQTTFKALDTGHKLNDLYITEVQQWLRSLGYNNLQ